MAIPTITPNTQDFPSLGQSESVFEANTNHLLANYMPQFETEFNASVTDINNTVTDINNTVTDINNTKDEITVLENNTKENTDIAKSVANNKGEWSNLTGELDIPASVTHNNGIWILNINLDDVTTSEPATDNTDWTKIDGIDSLVEDTTPQLGGDLDLNGYDIPISYTQQTELDKKQSILQSSYTQIDDATLDTGTHTFDYALGDYQQLTVTGDITLAFSNFVAGKVCSFVCELIGAGDYTITLPDGIEFDSKTAPEFTSGTDVVGVVSDKDGVLSMYVIALDRGAVA